MTTGEGDIEETLADDEPPGMAGTDEVAELRRRLDLIENSRTWRLRGKLARLLPTRR